MKPTVIDLFAGCGGLGLGLEQAGFETIFVNELHQDALSTYLLNRSDTSLKERQNHSNDILEITQQPAELDALADRLQREHGDVTLVAGGPPCQGYSGIGHRRSFVVTKDEIPSNHLYREMAKVVERVAPKAFLFENVKGLLSARWTPGGDKGEIWVDVQAAFRKIRVTKGGEELHYQLGWQLISAKDYGVPQNRPRVLLIGIRSDIPFSPALGKAANGLLPESVGKAPDPIDFLGDLVDPEWRPGGSTTSYVAPARTDAQRRMRTLPTGEVLAKGARLTEHEYGNHAPHILAKFDYMLATRRRDPGRDADEEVCPASDPQEVGGNRAKHHGYVASRRLRPLLAASRSDRSRMGTYPNLPGLVPIRRQANHRRSAPCWRPVDR